MRFKPVRYCPRGHDKYAPHGMASDGRCGPCTRERNRINQANSRKRRKEKTVDQDQVALEVEVEELEPKIAPDCQGGDQTDPGGFL